jgi:hypothetical protein
MDDDNTDGVLMKVKQVTLDPNSRHKVVSSDNFPTVIKASRKGIHAATWVADALVRVVKIYLVTSTWRSRRVRKDNLSTIDIDRRNISSKRDTNFPDLVFANSRYVIPKVVGNSIRDDARGVFKDIL